MKGATGSTIPESFSVYFVSAAHDFSLRPFRSASKSMAMVSVIASVVLVSQGEIL